MKSILKLEVEHAKENDETAKMGFDIEMSGDKEFLTVALIKLMADNEDVENIVMSAAGSYAAAKITGKNPLEGMIDITEEEFKKGEENG